MQTKILLRLLLRLIIVVVIGVGLFHSVYGTWGAFQPWVMLFYTSLSNAMVMLLFILLCISDVRLLRGKTSLQQNWASVKVAFTWAISITGIVWHVVLVPAIEQHIQNPQTVAYFLPMLGAINLKNLLLSMTLLHSYVPLLVVLDWLFFDRKGGLKLSTPLKWLLIPAFYFIFICAWVYGIGPVNSLYKLTFPYSFIDFTEHPAIEVWRNVALITIGLVILAYVYWGIDYLLGKIQVTFFSSIVKRSAI